MSGIPAAGGNQQHLAPPSGGRGSQEVARTGDILAGNFVIEDVIGQGGMAVVYRATQKSLNRPVAVKILHSRFARDPEFVSRFEAEAGALASLQHPNIVNIIDRGHDGDRYFFVMEHVDGETLDQLIIQNQLTPQDWRRIITACRDALDYVHRRGVVHRDIKPSNILVGREGLIKIGDFGIAHIITGGPIPQTMLQSPKAMGTANYMAPEQTSDPVHVDHRADIYSLGVTFYKMFARTLPAGADFPLPSEANTDVPVSVDDVILKAMARDRDARYESVAAFCDELLKALKSQSTSITSIMTHRKGTKGSALYTGADFRNVPQQSDKTPKPKAPEEKPRAPKKNEKNDLIDPGYSTSSLLKKLTPLPLGSESETPEPRKDPTPVAIKDLKQSQTKAKTPAPLKTEGGPAQSTAKPSNSLPKIIAIASTLVAMALIAIVVFAVMSSEDQGTSAGANDENGTITEKRNQILEDIIKEKNEGLDQESVFPTQTPMGTAEEQTAPAPQPDNMVPIPEDI